MAADTFGKFRTSINRGIATISVKTSSSLEKTKLKTHIDSLQQEIRKLYYEAGEASYMRWAFPESDGPVPEAIFESIRNKHQQIDALTKELAGIDERDSQILGTQSDKPSQVICPSCGARYDTPVKFCRGCGSKLQE